ncbi:hypothetical protein F5878DRAFT_520744, partial [Lentinula raphanica]
GFIHTFTEFWTQDPNDERSEEELEDASTRLLRGCEEHFRASVTRIKKIHGVVPVGSEDQFEALALGLIKSKSHDDFYARVEVIQREFPLADSWLGWWLRESNAEMLFRTHTRMEPDIWDSIPNTTNAQEAQHWKLYSSVGHDHSLLQGLEALHAVSVTIVTLFEANLNGGLIRYGQAEPWKAMINLIGRSKPTRAASSRKSRQKSDGHPPDTKQELLSKSPTKKKLLRSASSRKSGQKSDGRPPDTKQDLLSKSPTKEKLLQSKQKPVSSGVVVGPASYRWIENSCWIDSALDILYRAISNDYASFSTRFSSTTQTERPIRDLYNLVSLRREAENQALILRDPSYDLWDTLSHQRNSFREKLVKWRIIKNNHSHDNIFEWFPKLMKAKLSEDTNNDNWTQTYFQSMFATIKYCSGEGQHGQHCQIRSNAEIRYYITLKDHICGQFKGDISAYFQMIANVNHVPEAFPSCWRTRNGIPECKGSHTDVRFLLSFPVVLALEEEELDGAGATEFWDFPKTLCPFKAGDLRRTTYDIVGRVFFSRSKRHYITRFISNDKKTVWTYDDMNHHGCPYMEPNSSVESHLTGRYPTLNLPSDFVGVFVIYHLRGGTAMQEKIFSSQLAAARRIHHIIVEPDTLRGTPPTMQISRSKFERLAPSDLTWLMNPFQVTTIDYNEVSIPHTPTAEA